MTDEDLLDAAAEAYLHALNPNLRIEVNDGRREAMGAALEVFRREQGARDEALRVLQRDCTDYGHTEHYEMQGVCSNCGQRYRLVIPLRHEAPGSFGGWDCAVCANPRVGAVISTAAAPASPEVE